MSWRSLGDVFSVIIFRLPRHFQDVFANVFKTSWKMENCYAEDVLKTSSRHVLKKYSRRLQDQQMFAEKTIETREHVWHNTRKVQETWGMRHVRTKHLSHEAFRARKHVGHKVFVARKHIGNKVRRTRGTWGTRPRKGWGTWCTGARKARGNWCTRAHKAQGT